MKVHEKVQMEQKIICYEHITWQHIYCNKDSRLNIYAISEIEPAWGMKNSLRSCRRSSNVCIQYAEVKCLLADLLR